MLSGYTHSPIDFYFRKDSNNFVVTEIPLYDFSNDGEWLILKIRKKNLNTFDVIKYISEVTGAKKKDIGYAGLKDKHSMSIQYISLHKKYLPKIKNISHPQIKILETFFHKNKLKIGHLKGNKFFIRLKKVNSVNAKKIEQVLKNISKYGMANYYGYQRFGNEEENIKKGEKILKNELDEKNKRLKNLYISAYQSFMFNKWLEERIKLSLLVDEFSEKELKNIINFDIKYLKNQNHIFKLLRGDLLSHYPYGRNFILEDEEDIKRFENKEISPTGLMFGKKVQKSLYDAREIEQKYDIDTNLVDGSRRFAWVFPEILDYKYNEDNAWFEMNFILPKGSYATVLLESIANKKLEVF